MSVGRIECYMHSDATTPNKGASLIKVLCQTDFGARTMEFIAFSKKAALCAYAAKAEKWRDIVDMFPEMETERNALQKAMKEDVLIIIHEIVDL